MMFGFLKKCFLMFYIPNLFFGSSALSPPQKMHILLAKIGDSSLDLPMLRNQMLDDIARCGGTKNTKIYVFKRPIQPIFDDDKKNETLLDVAVRCSEKIREELKTWCPQCMLILDASALAPTFPPDWSGIVTGNRAAAIIASENIEETSVTALHELGHLQGLGHAMKFEGDVLNEYGDACSFMGAGLCVDGNGNRTKICHNPVHRYILRWEGFFEPTPSLLGDMWFQNSKYYFRRENNSLMIE